MGTSEAKPWEVPYPKLVDLDAARAGRVFNAHGFIAELLTAAGVPSFSPGMVGWVLSTLLPRLDEVIARIEAAPDAERAAQGPVLTILREYRESTDTICRIAVHQQQAVIDQIQRTLRVQHAQDLGIPAGQEDGLENLLMLQALADLGRKGPS